MPWGAGFLPFTLAKVEGPKLQSPDGSTLRVYFNDAGAAHSGLHWTWVVQNSWLLGKTVVAAGFVSPEVVMGDKPFPLEWKGPHFARVDFDSGSTEFDF